MAQAITFDHYFAYDEMTSILQSLASEYPGLMKLSSAGQSWEGREVWVAEITNLATGDFSTKPAYYLDGNHHAGEVTGSMAAMHFIVHLVQNYGTCEKVTALLDASTVYVIPRVSPDGAEAFLTTAEQLRSVNRPYPFEEKQPGLHPKDMDGDGAIRLMRVASPYGAWKESEKDPRWMIKRQPDDLTGTYYNVYPEGEIIDYDGVNIMLAPNKWGLDFNRNYPFGWFSEVRQPGAGAYPLSNPENKALVEFVLAHKNIVCGATNHTCGGIIIYPPGTKPEKQADQFDMKLYHEIGKMGTEEMGYACTNIFDEFLGDQEAYSSGAYDDWLYQTQGIPAYTIEFWDLMIRAGVKNFWPTKEKHEKTAEEMENDFYLAIQWIDQNVGKDAIMPWTKIAHPQLGEVEIGGFDFKFTVQNPPCNFLQQEVEKGTRFMMRYAAALPHLALTDGKSEKQADGVYKISAVVTNTGYLPTYGSKEAVALKIDQPIIASIDGASVISAAQPASIGHLEGFSGVKTAYSYQAIMTSAHEPCAKKLEWIVSGNAGDVVTVGVQNAKAGTASLKIEL